MKRKLIVRVCNKIEQFAEKTKVYLGEDKKSLDPHIVANINFNASGKQKKILISYLDFIATAENINARRIHTNNLELYKIIQYFIKRNYCLDVCACNDMKSLQYIENQKYDIVLGLGNVYRNMWEKEAVHILYMTENPYNVSLKKEKERLDYLYERKGIKAELCRTGKYYHEHDEEMADFIICTGDPQYYNRGRDMVKKIWPSAMINGDEIDYGKRKIDCFLVFGANGFIHKGNDILIDVFRKHPEWELYMCGNKVSSQAKEYGYELSGNIHDCGYIDVQTDIFMELADKCCFILLPSCSEAPSTAVMTGMCHGMIPIIMHGNGMDELSQYCEYFDDFTIESIEQKLNSITQMSIQDAITKGERIRQFACAEFTLDNYYRQFGTIMDQILDEGIN